MTTAFIDNNKVVNRLTNIVDSFVNNAQNVTSTDAIIPRRFDENIYKRASYEAPFFEFLKSKGRITSTDSSKVAFRVKNIEEEDRASFGNETASNITATDVSWTATPYNMAVVGKKIAVSDMAQMGNEIDLLGDDRVDAFLDIQTCIDEALFNAAANTNKFDGVKATTQNSLNLAGDQVTCKDVDSIVNSISLQGGKVDAIIATGDAVTQILDDDDSQKVFNDKSEVEAGRWATKYRTSNGSVPLITDANINARAGGVVETNSNAVYIIDSFSIGGKVLMDAASVPLAKTDLSESELLASFISIANINPYRNGVIKNIGTAFEVPLISSLAVSVKDESDVAVQGALVEIEYPGTNKTCTTGAAGGCSITSILPGTYDASVTKTGYDTLEESVTITPGKTLNFVISETEATGG